MAKTYNQSKVLFFSANFIVAVLTLSIMATSCNKESVIQNQNSQTDGTKTTYGEGETVLGAQLNDPYRLCNMQKALEILLDECHNTSFPASIEVNTPIQSISPTGYYVKALPTALNDLDKLEDDTNIVWFDFPLDYEIIKHGTYYHDPTVNDSNYTWLYAVIPVGHPLLQDHLIDTIYSVYIPDDDPSYNGNEEFFDRLEDISFTLTDSISLRASTKWYPSASITAYDDLKGTIGLQGVRVKVKQEKGCKSGYKVTDANGNCTLGKKYKDYVYYSIDWHRAYWKIRYNNNDASTPGPKKKNAQWQLNINSSSEKDLMYATIHRAALHCFYGTFGGVTKPTKTLGRLKIKYVHQNNGRKIGEAKCMNSSATFSEDICIWGKDTLGYMYNTKQIYSAVTHELAHESHKKDVGSNNLSHTDLQILESWALCVEWKLTSSYYANELIAYGYFNGDGNGYQFWIKENGGLPYAPNIAYSPLFIDLIDEYNQGSAINSLYPNDQIHNYTLPEIENILKMKPYTLESLKIKLKQNKYHGATDSQIDMLFSAYGV